MTRSYKPSGNDTRPLKYRLIANSEVIKAGDFITDKSTGAENTDGLTKKILGFATTVCTPQKISFQSPTVTTSSYGGTYVSSTQQYTAASDNETVDGILVEYIPLREGDQIVATLSANKGTTTGSNKEGYYLGIKTSNSSQLDEATASTSSSNTQFIIRSPFTQGLSNEVIVECILRQENA